MPDDERGIADGQHLGMRRGIAGQLAFVVPRGDHFAVAHDHRSDRNIAVRNRRRRLLECQLHRVVVGQR